MPYTRKNVVLVVAATYVLSCQQVIEEGTPASSSQCRALARHLADLAIAEQQADTKDSFLREIIMLQVRGKREEAETAAYRFCRRKRASVASVRCALRERSMQGVRMNCD